MICTGTYSHENLAWRTRWHGSWRNSSMIKDNVKQQTIASNNSISNRSNSCAIKKYSKLLIQVTKKQILRWLQSTMYWFYIQPNITKLLSTSTLHITVQCKYVWGQLAYAHLLWHSFPYNVIHCEVSLSGLWILLAAGIRVAFCSAPFFIWNLWHKDFWNELNPFSCIRELWKWSNFVV